MEKKNTKIIFDTQVRVGKENGMAKETDSIWFNFKIVKNYRFNELNKKKQIEN